MSAEVPLQGTSAQGSWTIYVAARNGRRVRDWEPRLASDRRVEVVPREVAERLAAALEGIHASAQKYGYESLAGFSEQALIGYRAVFPKAEEA